MPGSRLDAGRVCRHGTYLITGETENKEAGRQTQTASFQDVKCALRAQRVCI